MRSLFRSRSVGHAGATAQRRGASGGGLTLAYHADTRTPNSWYRALGPMQALANQGHAVRPASDLHGNIRPQALDGCDALLIHRLTDAGAQLLAVEAKRRGMGLVWDTDDDILAVPKANVASRAARGLAGQTARRELRRMLAAADVASAPSTFLADRLAELGARETRVLENYVRDDLQPCRTRPRDDGRVVVGWLAGGEHHIDVDRLPISEACERLLKEHPTLEIVTIGARLRLRHDRYRNVRDISFLRLHEHLGNLDVGIAPIADIPFNCARSNVKLKEYAVLGVPWLASPIGPYAGHGESEGGRLVADDAWEGAIADLVTDRRERDKLAKRALKWGRSQRVGLHADAWRTTLTRAAGRR